MPTLLLKKINAKTTLASQITVTRFIVQLPTARTLKSKAWAMLWGSTPAPTPLLFFVLKIVFTQSLFCRSSCQESTCGGRDQQTFDDVPLVQCSRQVGWWKDASLSDQRWSEDDIEVLSPHHARGVVKFGASKDHSVPAAAKNIHWT